MVRTILTTLLVTLLLSTPAARPCYAQTDPPISKEAWIATLGKLAGQDPDSYRVIRQFTLQDDDLVYNALREGWSQIKDRAVRMNLVTSILQGKVQSQDSVESAPEINPHFLDIVALQLNEPKSAADGPPGQPGYAQLQMLNEAEGIALQPVPDAAAFAAWRSTITAREVRAVLAEGAGRVVSALKGGNAERTLRTLTLLRRLTYYTGISTSSNNGVITRSATAGGLVLVRREALLAAGLTAVLGRLLRAENPELVLARLRPEDDALAALEPEMKRELPRVLRRPHAPVAPAIIFRQDDVPELLTAYKGDWAADEMAALLLRDANAGTHSAEVVNAIDGPRSPRIIPTLIAIVEADEKRPAGNNPYLSTLLKAAQLPFDPSDDSVLRVGMWWRIWWHDNRGRFGRDARNLAIPHISARQQEFVADPPEIASARRRVERVSIGADDERSYWLIGPGWRPTAALSDEDKDAIARSGLTKFSAANHELPGLVVAVTDADTDDPACLDTWLDVSDALGRSYFIALVKRPKWPGFTADAWLTEHSARVLPHPGITTEALVDQVVRQMALNAAVDPDRVFLVGVGTAGSAAYACALRKETPFRGFCLLSAPYRTAVLPQSLAPKGRKFYIGLGLEGRGGLDALAESGMSLARSGAVVKMEKVVGGREVDGVREAIRWLTR
jgi:hypothetical protein